MAGFGEHTYLQMIVSDRLLLNQHRRRGLSLYESLECAHVSIHTIAKVACYRLERTLMGCGGFHYGIRGSHQCSRFNEKRSGGESSLASPAEGLL